MYNQPPIAGLVDFEKELWTATAVVTLLNKGNSPKALSPVLI